MKVHYKRMVGIVKGGGLLQLHKGPSMTCYFYMRVEPGQCADMVFICVSYFLARPVDWSWGLEMHFAESAFDVAGRMGEGDSLRLHSVVSCSNDDSG